MATIERITDEQGGGRLADRLNGNARRRPIVVVTTPAGRAAPWIDADEVAREAGDLAEVYVMQTGDASWEFSRRMAEGTQVYGGAGRVYPVGHGWASDWSKSPLRFAFGEAEGERATQQLISDALRMAASAGLAQQSPRHVLRRVEGSVVGIVAGRALVDVGNHFPAAIAEELTVADVSIDRIVSPGQELSGWYDVETNRLDITKSLRASTEALATYEAGQVILARVAAVKNGKAELVVYPRTTTPAVTVTVYRIDVTSNPADDLRTLMTVGEVIPARVVAAAPQWSLVLNDVDDDEPIVAAPALLDGGPPWIVEEIDDFVEEESEALALPSPALPSPARTIEPEADHPPVPVRPNPTMLDRNRAQSRPIPAPPPAQPVASAAAPESTKSLLLKIDGLNAEITRLTREKDALRGQILAGSHERETLRHLLDQEERRANRAEHDLKSTKSRLRKAGNARAHAATGDRPSFADAEQGFRYLVLTQWATRTSPSEQHDRPLPEFTLGPRFLESLDELEGIKPEKVADVVFEIVTGLAPQLSGREVHRLRSGTGGDDPVRVREDGAVAWRASLQVNSPSARRIHYWALPNGSFEIAQVSTHDDFDV